MMSGNLVFQGNESDNLNKHRRDSRNFAVSEYLSRNCKIACIILFTFIYSLIVFIYSLYHFILLFFVGFVLVLVVASVHARGDYYHFLTLTR